MNGIPSVLAGAFVLLGSCDSLGGFTHEELAATAFVPAQWSEISAFTDDTPIASLRTAAENSLQWFMGRANSTTYNFGIRTVTRAEMIALYQDFIAIIANKEAITPEIMAVLAERFDLVKSVGQTDGLGMMATGYYVPELEMRLEPEGDFTIPAYRVPDDLASVLIADFGTACAGGTLVGSVSEHKLIPNNTGSISVKLEDFGATCDTKSITGRVTDANVLAPYYTRHQIRAEHALDGKGLEIAYVKDEVALFFTEVQGSATANLKNPERKTLHYMGSNGRPYSSIGKLLVSEGRIPADKISMQTLRAYLAAASPEEVRRVLDSNESFVFFDFIHGGARGVFDFEVTQHRSVAMDQKIFPANALGFINVEKPAIDDQGNRAPSVSNMTRFVLNQDTGGAIKGAGRVDLFWGSGSQEEALAGVMQSRGQFYLLVPRRQ